MRFLRIVKYLLISLALILAILWIFNSQGNYEPWTVIALIIVGLIESFERIIQRKPPKSPLPPSPPPLKNKITVKNKESTSKNIHQLTISSNSIDVEIGENYSVLITGSYNLLLSDKLAGSWGKTIGKYMDLTQDEGKWTDEDIFKYLLTGSLTHTFHALNGIFEYLKFSNKYIEPKIALDIIHYLKTWRLDFGTFATPVTNFDGSLGNPQKMVGDDADLFRKQIPQLVRHTSCGILVINRLLNIREVNKQANNVDKKTVQQWEELVQLLNNYNLRALQVLSNYSGLIKTGDSSIWGKVKYTPAYVVKAINEGLLRYNDSLKDEERENLNRFKLDLIEFAFTEAISPDESFFCQYSNRKAFYYYTLLFLEYFTEVEDFTSDPRAEQFVKKILLSLTNIIISNKGLSFGNAEIPEKSWLNYADIGITSRYLKVVSKYSSLYEIDSNLKTGFHRALEYVLDNIFDYNHSNRNSMTHGWEAILNLLSITDTSLKKQMKIIITSSTDGYKNKLEQYIAIISERDFLNRQPFDQQKRFIEILCSYDEDFISFIELIKSNNILNPSEVDKLKDQIELKFTQKSFTEFLDNQRIPYRTDSELEKMIDSTLFQYQFQL
jgi:hypothetical protein